MDSVLVWTAVGSIFGIATFASSVVGINQARRDHRRADGAASHPSRLRRKKQASSSQQAASPGEPGEIRIFRPPRSRNRHFTGRQDALARLASSLRTADRVAVLQAVSGLGGIGKTELVVEYANRYRDLYSIVFTIRAEAATTILQDLRMLAQQAGLSDSWNNLEPRVLGWLESRSDWLLIFDNAESLATVTPYLPRGPGHVLITSRDRVWRQRAEVIELDVWAESESLEFLRSRLGTISPQDEESAVRLVRLLSNFPLALEQAAAYMEETGTSCTAYVDLFRNSSDSLLTAGVPADLGYQESVASAWAVTFSAIKGASPPALTLLEACSLLAPDAIPEDMFGYGAPCLTGPASELAASPVELNEALGLLNRYGLVRRSAGTLSIHRLMQQVIRNTMAEQDLRARHEMCLCMLGRAFSADPGGDSIGPLLIPHIFAVFLHALALGSSTQSAQSLMMGAGQLMGQRAQLIGAQASMEDAVSVIGEIYGHGNPQVADSLASLGVLLLGKGDLLGARVYLEQAKQILEKLPSADPEMLASVYNSLTDVLRRQGDAHGADTYLRLAYEVHRGDAR